MAFGDELVKLAGGVGGESAQGLVEGDWGATFSFSVKEEGLGDFYVEHFFEAEGLGAELDFVGGVGFGFSAFVFDGDDRAVFVEFDDVALAAEAVGF